MNLVIITKKHSYLFHFSNYPHLSLLNKKNLIHPSPLSPLSLTHTSYIKQNIFLKHHLLYKSKIMSQSDDLNYDKKNLEIAFKR